MKTVEMLIQGGLVAAAKIPRGIRVVVRDYDIDGIDLDADDVHKDDNGDHYIKSVFDEEDSQCS